MDWCGCCLFQEFSLVEKHSQFREEVSVPYGQWLAEHDRFEEDQRDNSEKKEEMLKKFHSFQHLADLYHVYHSVHRFMFQHARDSLQHLPLSLPQPDQRRSCGHLQSVSFTRCTHS
ncbi:intraflagellar transport protein 122 homolog [Cyprinus carpio]|uniref:Intraflagellar transport protein 122 homolog n=1 Tax=Cyprinus carpio TaxID=7962 RepID=A0A9R0A5W9_CYPCA|nr:intraflagellar transport protein 122 homolog [Cyprinus carpio]